jgi:NMD protein affecting ribosome stability and mRNA decay
MRLYEALLQLRALARELTQEGARQHFAVQGSDARGEVRPQQLRRVAGIRIATASMVDQ